MGPVTLHLTPTQAEALLLTLHTVVILREATPGPVSEVREILAGQMDKLGLDAERFAVQAEPLEKEDDWI